MRILLDEQLPRQLAPELTGHEGGRPVRNVRDGCLRWVLALSIGWSLAAASALRAAEPDGAPGLLPPVKELSFHAMYGHPAEKSIEYVSFGPRVAFDLPDWVPELAGNRPRLAMELMGSVIDKLGTRYEIAVTPLLLDWRYDQGGGVVPYVEGGFGGLWTDLTRVSIGGRFEFSNQIGVGARFQLGEGYELTLGYRFRHISNAGLRSPNHGINTSFLIFGLGWSARD